MTEVYILNAFSAVAEGGNPAGVVADASSMNEEDMQEVARVLGYSETAFVQPSSVPISKCDSSLLLLKLICVDTQ